MRALAGFRPASLFILGAVGAVSATLSSVAHGEEIAACDATVAPFKCASVVGSIKKTLDGDAGFSKSVDSGWMPKDPAADGHGDKTIQARVNSALDDTKVTVGLTSIWVARWGSNEPGLAKGRLRIGPRESSSSGEVKVVYKLYPALSLYVNAFGFKGEIDLATNDVLNVSPGSSTAGELNYAANCNKTYSPWGFGTASPPCQVKDDSADGGTLFSFEQAKMIGFNGAQPVELVGFSTAIRVGTTAGFTWTTNEISVLGGSKVIDATNDVLDVAYDGSGSVSLTAQAKGTVAYKGVTYYVPTVTIAELNGLNVNLSIPIGAAKVEAPFDATTPPTTIASTIVIPVPNVQPLTAPISFGVIGLGEKKAITIKLPNTGKAAGRVQAITSDPAHFSLQVAAVVVPAEGDGELIVEVSSDQAGPLAGKVILTTNNVIDDPIEISLSGAVAGSGGAAGTGGAAGVGGASGAAGANAAGQAGAAGAMAAGGQAGAAGAGQAGSAGVGQAGTAGSSAGAAGANAGGSTSGSGGSAGALATGGSAGTNNAASGSGGSGARAGNAGAAGAVAKGGNAGAAGAPASAAPAGSGDDGGCSTTGRGGNGALVSLLVALAALATGRRRGRG